MFRSASPQVPSLLDEEVDFLAQNGENVTIENLEGNIKKHVNDPSKTGNEIANSIGHKFYRSTFTASLRALNVLKDHFDFDSIDKTSESHLNNLDFKDGTVIIYLEHLDPEAKLMWQMQIVKWLYNNKKRDWESFIFLDEAHSIIPARKNDFGSDETFHRLKSNFLKLSREGRKFGLNLVLSTQNPRDVNEIVREQCATQIVMKVNSANAKYLDLDEKLGYIATKFSYGQFWILSPFNGSSEWIRVHNFPSNLPHESMNGYWKKLREEATKN
jgi:hypothetical protein